MVAAAPCVIESSHRRLDEAHAYWHDARDSYMDPHDFRRHFNVLLQCLRSVVYLAERKKRTAPNGESVLAAWRAEYGKDPIFRWGMDSRDLVVHEDDLLISSVATVEFSNSGRTYLIDRSTEPLLSNEELLVAMLLSKPESVRSGIITVARKWMANDLPDQELLAASASLYEMLRNLVNSLHAAPCAIELPTRACGEDSLSRASCMLFPSETTSISIDVATRSALVAEVRSIKRDPDWDPEIARERYGKLFDVGGNPVVSAMAHMKRASLYLAVDSEALPYVTLFQGDRPVEVLLLAAADVAKGGRFMYMAERIRASRADGFIYTSEVWTAHRKNPKPVHAHESTFYDLRPERDEALIVVAATADGRKVMFLRAFERDADGWPIPSERIDRSFTLPPETRVAVSALNVDGPVYRAPKRKR